MKVSGASDKSKKEGAPAQAVQSRGGSTGASVGRVEAAQSAFMDVVEDMESRQLIDELEEIGAQLTRYPSTALVGRYRSLVATILDRVRGGMHVRREFKWRRTERSMLITIEKTEGLLDELEEALFREGDRMRSLELIDEIKGCLISLLF